MEFKFQVGETVIFKDGEKRTLGKIVESEPREWNDKGVVPVYRVEFNLTGEQNSFCKCIEEDLERPGYSEDRLIRIYNALLKLQIMGVRPSFISKIFSDEELREIFGYEGYIAYVEYAKEVLKNA